ncbi:PKD domain-containing protein [Myxococcaceae bacterium GXIMD 01537]
MRTPRLPSEHPERSGVTGRSRVLAVLGGGLLVLALALVFRGGGEAPSHAAPEVSREVPRALPVSPVAAPSLEPSAPPPRPSDTVSAAAALSVALREERVVVASGVRIEGVDTDRPWVCAEEPMSLSARLGGAVEPGAESRWVWSASSGGASLQPGPRLQWRAPEKAGRYVVHFQVCRDLGGRRVGVLAERAVPIEVRDCAAGERQESESLRIAVVQRGPVAFTFEALDAGREALTGYAWDFGDGATMATAEPRAEHTFSSQGLGAQDTRSFTVKLEARTAAGASLRATTFALIRGQAPPEVPPPAALDVSRFRELPDGKGWRSDLVVRIPGPEEVTWERLERTRVRWDGEVEQRTWAWRDAVRVEETLELGGFRGYVTVSPEEAPPEIKQVLDSLYGRDATGQEVVVSWSPFKRPAPPEGASASPSTP